METGDKEKKRKERERDREKREKEREKEREREREKAVCRLTIAVYSLSLRIDRIHLNHLRSRCKNEIADRIPSK